MPAAIPGFDPSTPVNPPTTADATGSSALGKDDFMKLLLAQLANQDPTAPQDDQAFVAQLAQFAQLEASQGTNSRLDTLVSAQAASQSTQAVGFIDKSVVYNASSDESGGRVVGVVADHPDQRRQCGECQRARQHRQGGAHDQDGPADRRPDTVVWDGNDDGGNREPPGAYSLNVSATRRVRQGGRRQPAMEAVSSPASTSTRVSPSSRSNGYPRSRCPRSLQ